ncbi:Small RNA-binding protein 11, chloroplastic, partial [Cucurbita argyrosperma subsp. argyrosperma]
MSATIKATAISFNRRVLPPIFPPPSRLVSFRGIASKLFVGVYAYYNSIFHIEILVLEYFATVLPFYTAGKGLSEAFSRDAKVLMDRASVKSKGFGFVTFASEDEAHIVLTKMNGREKRVIRKASEWHHMHAIVARESLGC